MGLFDFDDLRKSFFRMNDFFKVPYYLKEKGDKYEVSVEYDENRDSIDITVNKDSRNLRVRVQEDWEKTDSVSYNVRYGSFYISVPDDCDIDSMKKVYDKENKVMTITFDRTIEETWCGENSECMESYKYAYENLKQEHEEEVKRLKTRIRDLEKTDAIFRKMIDNVKDAIDLTPEKIEKLWEK